MAKKTPERLIILFDEDIYPPLGGLALRARGFAEIYTPLVNLAESRIEEVIVAGSYHDVISTASLFPKTETVVVGLLTEAEWNSLDELERILVGTACETTLLYLARFPPDLDKKIALARQYKHKGSRCIDLIQALQYDSELLHSLFGIPLQVVLLISQNQAGHNLPFPARSR